MIVLVVTVWCAIAPAAALLIGAFLGARDKAAPEPDFLAYQPVDVLSDAEVARRFAQIQGQLRHPSGREWLA